MEGNTSIWWSGWSQCCFRRHGRQYSRFPKQSRQWYVVWCIWHSAQSWENQPRPSNPRQASRYSCRCSFQVIRGKSWLRLSLFDWMSDMRTHWVLITFHFGFDLKITDIRWYGGWGVIYILKNRGYPVVGVWEIDFSMWDCSHNCLSNPCCQQVAHRWNVFKCGCVIKGIDLDLILLPPLSLVWRSHWSVKCGWWTKICRNL